MHTFGRWICQLLHSAYITNTWQTPIANSTRVNCYKIAGLISEHLSTLAFTSCTKRRKSRLQHRFRQSMKHSQQCIWTSGLENSFYGAISHLLLKKINQPRPPDYGAWKENVNQSEHLLAPEDEFHLANQIAFLASYKEGVNYVSAATVQERTTPPALLIRLASNKTPNDFVVQKLQGIFKVLRAYASRSKET